jgi:hypothetical protein
VVRGRKTLTKILHEKVDSREPPTAPAHYRLTNAEKAVWNEAMRSCPVGFIDAAMYPVFAQYCRLTERAKTLGEWAEGYRKNGDVKQYKSLTRTEMAVTRMVKSLSSALCLAKETKFGRKARAQRDREQGKTALNHFDKPEAWSHGTRQKDDAPASHAVAHKSTDVSPWSTAG